MQDVPPEDIDRIEVISGPGATLWGANAVNGVINIITRKSSDTQGGVIDVGAGNLEQSVSLQFGGRIAPDLTWRIYAKTFSDSDTVTAAGAPAHDNWSKPQGGFRLDWDPGSSDTVTLQGDTYRGYEAQDGAPDEDISGSDVLARWNHSWQGGASLQVQAYWDRAERSTRDAEGGLRLDTWDLDVQDNFALGARDSVVMGGGFRLDRYAITNTPSLLFEPPRGNLDLSNLFVQDSFALTRSLTLIAGLKLENDPYSGISPLPSLRLSWKAAGGTLLWAAVSRAIRSPTPFDTDVVEKIGRIIYLTGTPDFQPETLTAYEVGVRAQPTPRLSFSVSAYYNVYDDLRSVETAPVGFIPFRWGNMIEGDTFGLEAWGDYRLARWWRLTASFDFLKEQLKFKPGASRLLPVIQEGDDPKHQASLRSSMDLGRNFTLDADLRYVDALPDPSVPAYVELDSRIAWNVSRRVQLSLSGFNLLHARHLEFPGADAVPRSAFAEVRLRF